MGVNCNWGSDEWPESLKKGVLTTRHTLIALSCECPPPWSTPPTNQNQTKGLQWWVCTKKSGPQGALLKVLHFLNLSWLTALLYAQTFHLKPLYPIHRHTSPVFPPVILLMAYNQIHWLFQSKSVHSLTERHCHKPNENYLPIGQTIRIYYT